MNSVRVKARPQIPGRLASLAVYSVHFWWSTKVCILVLTHSHVTSLCPHFVPAWCRPSVPSHSQVLVWQGRTITPQTDRRGLVWRPELLAVCHEKKLAAAQGQTEGGMFKVRKIPDDIQRLIGSSKTIQKPFKTIQKTVMLSKTIQTP